LAPLSKSPLRPDVPDFTGPAVQEHQNMNPDTWNLVHQIQKTGNLLKALDQFIEHPPRRDVYQD
jgi:hypothetical protein